MEEDIPPIIELTPKLKGVRCRFLGYLLYTLLSFLPVFVGLYVWYKYNFWIGIAFFLFLTLIMGIVVSKMRLASLPPSQREMTYTNMEVARWYLSKNIC